MVLAKSPSAQKALLSVEELQKYFVTHLNRVAEKFGNGVAFERVSWLRDEGRHGGGSRYEARDTLFNRASVNVSQVHYDDNAKKTLSSATAVSTIIHPNNPHAPSMHMHISWTQMRDGKGYWRVMADLNPSISNDEDTYLFDTMLKKAAKEYYAEGYAQGKKYFNIPVLKRTRGVSHFYLENFNNGNFEEDRSFVFAFGKSVVDTYINIITNRLEFNTDFTKKEKEKQRDYHTLYLFQVLTLDRGTTSGLLVHSQNDVGIMGSIPSHVNKKLLKSWIKDMPKPQDELLAKIVEVLGEEDYSLVDESIKKELADVVRRHYTKYPQALSLQAAGESTPPTVANHS